MVIFFINDLDLDFIRREFFDQCQCSAFKNIV